MSLIFDPNYLDNPQQIQQNKEDIETLMKFVKQPYHTKGVLVQSTTKIDKSITDVPDGTESGFLVDAYGNVFNIISLNENDLYIDFWFSIKGESGAQGEQGPRGEQGIQGIQGMKGEKGDPGSKGDRGEQGIQGIQGIQGVQGEQGLQGQQGEQGIQGLQGIQGEKGENGNSFIITGTVDTVSDLPSIETTNTGTSYFVGTVPPRDVYTCVNYNNVKIWQNQGKLQGPQGQQGEQGIQGIQGIQGVQGEQGIQGIQGIQGVQGIDGKGFNFMGTWITDNEYFENDVVTYSTNDLKSAYVLITETLTGSTTPPPEDTTNWQLFTQGTQGPQGEQGPQGIQGPQGVQGEKGDPGIEEATTSSIRFSSIDGQKYQLEFGLISSSVTGTNTIYFEKSFSDTPLVLLTRNEVSSGKTNSNFNWLRGMYPYNITSTHFTISDFNGEGSPRSYLALGHYE